MNIMNDEQMPPEGEAIASFEPVSLLADLKARTTTTPPPDGLPDHLPLSAISLMPDLFQPRGMAENHISELTRVVKSGRVLDPVTVVQVGADTILIDGHHRFEAYRLAGLVTLVPVQYFAGTVDEAVLEAGKANSRAKLSMSVQERMDYAWRLVRMGCFSKAKIADAAVVSDGQVAEMRRVMKVLGDEAFDCDVWLEARKLADGKAGMMPTDEEIEQRLELQAAIYADRMAKVFSTKLATNPALAARAFDMYFGRKLPDLAEHLREYLPDVEGEDADDDY
ncbi:ParB/RepB/Spo0J family partition protein [Magnetospirillum fulvum]|uniref:Nuclease n=1 Tax=Magnetospirillum fulvum MGU-K5 TaxID=1316936 RepID=S9SC37_MAGFU|nr:ParB/RepB/Spo0J family partition protein [Magnetospirillum fulvum]EPY01628.1 nuclease [Magnetospirillum fulvum MGU-K5]